MYQVANLITTIKNSAAARRRTATVPYSNMSRNIGQVLVKEGFLTSIKEDTVDKRRVLVVTLKFTKRMPAVRDVKIVSKPSLRVYASSKKVHEVKISARHKVILSTNKGIMEAGAAQKEGIGGEILFTINS
ncbi:MAG: 30S ribosomal protein S8 [Candidatus Levybacteria bacterium]|nr:30S ribosomal protein S8 [Candidatus Levybacteria bacterium]